MAEAQFAALLTTLDSDERRRGYIKATSGLVWLLLGTACFAPGATWEAHSDAGLEAYQQGDYAEAEKQWMAAVRKAEAFEPQDPRLATSLNNLAELYHTQGQYAQAEPLYKRALAIYEKALGPDHPSVATSLENYADLLQKTGRTAEAEELEERARAIRAKER